MGAKSFISAAVRMPRVRRSLLLGATGQKSCAGQEEDTHIGLERRPRLPFLPMTGVPKCSGLVRGSLSSVCGGQTTQPQHKKAKMNAAAAEPTARHQTIPFINCGGRRSSAGRPATHLALRKVTRSFQAERGTPQGLLVAVVKHCRHERRAVRLLLSSGQECEIKHPFML